MAIEGGWERKHSEPAPYVEGRVKIARLGVEGDMRFLVDTGADATTLQMSDRRRLGIPLSQLSPQVYVESVGGLASYSQEPASVWLYDRAADAWRIFSIMIEIYDGEGQADDFPSLLGLDVLNRCRCAIDASAGSVLLEPVLVDEASGAVYYPPSVRRLG